MSSHVTTKLSLSQEDYMSLEVIDGKVVYKFDLGAGVGIIENPAVVNDGEWHEVAVERWVVGIGHTKY